MAVTIARTHFAYPRRHGQAALVYVTWLNTKMVYRRMVSHLRNNRFNTLIPRSPTVGRIVYQATLSFVWICVAAPVKLSHCRQYDRHRQYQCERGLRTRGSRRVEMLREPACEVVSA